MFTEYLPTMILAWSLHAFALASPGPNVLAVIGTSMSSGRRTASAMCLGIATGTLIWASATVAGLSALLAGWAAAMTVLKFAGAAYLAWLSAKSFRAALRPGAVLAPVALTLSPGRLFLRGFLVQMSNPKAALSWVAIVSLGLGAGAPWLVAVVFVAGAAMNSLLIHLFYAVTFSTRPVVTAYLKARRWIDVVLGGLFAFAAFKLATART